METSRFEYIRKELSYKMMIPAGSANLKAAWRFAYYNPAKQDSKGNVVIRQSHWIQFLGYGMCATWTIGMTISQSYNLLIVPCILFTAMTIFTIFFYKPKTITFNKNGIIFKGVEYNWEDYIGAFFFATTHRGSSAQGLVLIRADGKYVYLNILTIAQIDIIGTAIRDFQPDHYKTLS